MKKKVFTVLLAVVLVCSFSLVAAVPAAAADPTTIESSTMVFEGALIDNGGETYSGTIPMVDGAGEVAAGVVGGEDGFDNYARDGATAAFSNSGWATPGETLLTIALHDAYPGWPTDVPDWSYYALTLDGNIWKLVYNEDTPDRNWKTRGGVPMSGIMDWTNMYASETDFGSSFGYEADSDADVGAASTDANYGFAAANGAGPACWDIDWIPEANGSEVVPLAFPGFAVEVTDLTGGNYRVTLTPAAGDNPPGPVVNEDTGESFGAIQPAIDAPETLGTHTITVAAGEYAGAIVNEDLNIIGAAGGASIITSGVPYKVDSPLLTGFRLDDGADGAEIRNFTMNGNYNTAGKFWFAVFARNADSVIVDLLTLDDMVQGISNWGGSNWEITNNVIGDTYPTYGGGIAIYLGADPGGFPHCDNNLVQGNIISTSAEQKGNFTGAAICLWFDMRGCVFENGVFTDMAGDESITGNEIKDNSITASGLENQVGIEIGVGGLDGDENPDKVAACLGVIHDNTVTNNTIDDAEWGLYTYVTTDLTVQRNTIKNCSDCGIYMKDDHANCLINYNDIYGNTNYGLNNSDGAAYERTVDATKNWWGNASGPDGDQGFTGPYTGVLPGTGNKVSAKVQSMPWLTRPFEKVLGDDIAYFGISFPALKGWNIVSAPLALDAHVITADGFTANTWDGLLNLGKKEGDEYALNLHYTVVEGVGDAEDVKDYTPIYYYDSDPTSDESGWRQVTELTNEINPVDAFYIRMMESDSIPILFSPDFSVPSKKLYQGWNLVGCAYMDVMFEEEDGQPLVETALATIAEVSSPTGDVTGYSQVVSPPLNQEPWIYIPSSGIIIPSTAVSTILMGKGYWVFMENPGTLAGLTFTPISLPK